MGGVFLNFPYDNQYARKLRYALAFAVRACGFMPRIAAEVVGSEVNRLDLIWRMVCECPLSLHDLSRSKGPNAKYPRYNMPFELGLAEAALRLLPSTDASPRGLLILDYSPDRYDRAISDIKGKNIEAHGGDAQRLASRVVAWLNRYRKVEEDWRQRSVQIEFDIYYRGIQATCRAQNKREESIEWSTILASVDKFLDVRAQKFVGRIF